MTYQNPDIIKGLTSDEPSRFEAPCTPVIHGVIHGTAPTHDSALECRAIGPSGTVIHGAIHAMTEPPFPGAGPASRQTQDIGGRSPRDGARYIALRGRTYHFQKRLPKDLAFESSRTFWRASLRTPLPSEAMSRAAALLTGLDHAERAS